MNRSTPNLPLDAIETVLAREYGLEGALTEFMSERDQNVRVVTDGDTYLFKVCNIDEDPAVVDFQIKALHHIAQRDPSLPVPRSLPTLSGHDSALIDGPDSHIIRLMSYLSGDMVRQHLHSDTPALRRSTGRLVAQLDLALRGFFHPAAQQDHPWIMTSLPLLLPYVEHIVDKDARRNIANIIERMRDEVLPRASTLRHQVVHQDAHTGNLVVDPDDLGAITGIIDFGDLVYAPLIMDLAIAGDLSGRPSPSAEGLVDLAIGYDEVLPLEEGEIDILLDLCLGRMAMTATIAAARSALYPDDDEYHDNETGVWERIEGVLEVAPEVRRELRRGTRFPVALGKGATDLVTGRTRVLGENSPHFYQNPVHLERAEGVWMIGADGRRYLDFYNNVPTVGHGHPHVVKAVARQMAALNTHTRYLYNNVVEYADRLTATLSDDLDVCLFVNSGSEANDVAWQIAQLLTDNDGLLVMHQAYHGITQAGIAMTTAKSLDKAANVDEIPAPDDYRHPTSTAESARSDTQSAIARLADRGHDVAAFIVDSAMCSSGIPDTPEDFLGAIGTIVQSAGGLVIADEVQSGFGRLGGMWGHQVLGMAPDIVTLGKPVGNGHPMGVVITKRAILEAFQAKVRLFSTFGGNPVSCAAGLAVLDVIEREGLVENSRTTGDYLRAELWKLAERHEIIGDVRGRGLLVGLDLVRNRDSKEGATTETLELLEILRENGILAGKDGQHSHILKLRPPLVTKREHVDIFVAALDRSLTTTTKS